MAAGAPAVCSHPMWKGGVAKVSRSLVVSPLAKCMCKENQKVGFQLGTWPADLA